MTKTIKSKVLISALFVALLCILISVAIALPTSAEELTPTASGSCGENATWEYYASTGELKIFGSGEMDNCLNASWRIYRPKVKTVTIAEGITSIGDYAFSQFSILTSIEIPSSVTSIGVYAFSYCSSLANIEIPSSVANIGERGFSNCSALTNVTFEENSKLTSIGNYAFPGCSSLKKIEVPSSVTSIGEAAFVSCYLESVGFGDNSQLASIGERAFESSYSLTSIKIPTSVTSIGERAFTYCPKLIEIYNLSELDISCGSYYNGRVGRCAKVVHTSRNEESIIENIDGYQVAYFDDTYYLLGYTGEETDLILPSSFNYKGTIVTQYKIYDCAFMEKENIEKIEISSSVISIGDYAFQNCKGIINVTIPASVEHIGKGAFRGCPSLTSLNVEEENEFYYSVENCIIEAATKTLVIGCKNSVIPRDKSVIAIGAHAFDGCIGIETMEIPNNIEQIGSFAFAASSSSSNAIFFGSEGYTMSVGTALSHEIGLKKIVFEAGSKIKKIGNYAFSYCVALTSIEIPSSVTNIDNGAFNNCLSLTSIKIPTSVTSIGPNAFRNCRSLLSIKIPTSVTSVGSQAFYGCDNLIQVENGVSYVDIWAVGCDTSVTEVSLRENTVGIADGAFSGCSALTSMEIPSSVKNVGINAFSGCVKLIQVENGVSYVDKWIIGCDTSVADVSIREDTVGIGSRAFYNCMTTSIEVSAKVTNISYQAFFNRRLTSVTFLSNEPASLGTDVFYPTNIKAIFVPTSAVETYKTHEDWSEYKDKIFAIGANTEPDPVYSGSCGPNATWEYCEETGELKILGSGEMYDYSETSNAPWYSYSSKIRSVTISEDITYIGDYAFVYCYHLTSIELPSNITSIGDNAFLYCIKLVEVYNLTLLDLSPSSELYTGIGLSNAVIHTSKEEESIIETLNGYQFVCLDDIYYLLGYIGKETDLILPTTFNYKEAEVDEYEIYMGAFYEIESLSGIEIPSSVIGIGEAAFGHCTALTSVKFEESGKLTIVGVGAFMNCSALTNIEFPSSVTSIGELAFYRCTALTSITMLPEEPASIGEYLFQFASVEAIYVPASAVDTYKSHEDWAEYKDIIFPIEETDTPKIKYGDANGDGIVNSLDVLVLRKYIANYNYEAGTSTVEVSAGADADGDGDIGASDVLLIRKYMANYNYTTGTSSIVLGPRS